ncbi:hypothetical protein [Actinoplanes couchii]|uniref:Knr4/Smi1-like domain-containing protein n=1 Tax=Actinoplanes couchii TaxID=403638 RepID=A0ABQ3XLL2_9ACTN|nr:hypothetical protein [Actinoplanes couchii]MDR6318258.1 hypothetical protein [Actinoplanes couchii]GID59371.1 hypothetical protein Aco03nite_077750 [Actinoplanes couchii]
MLSEGEHWSSWVRQWATDIDTATRDMTATFEATYGYPAGVNEVRWATADDRTDAGPLAPMAGFYQVVAEVSLPDVGNGIFIHSAQSALAQTEDPHGPVIGSTGGGTQFVLDRDGRVHRSVGASLDGDFVPVADSVEQFLSRLRHAVTEFVRHNRIVDLDNG